MYAGTPFPNLPAQAMHSVLRNGDRLNRPARSWTQTRLAYGHGETWWRQFGCPLRLADSDGRLSIEHGDARLDSAEELTECIRHFENLTISKRV